MKTLHQAYRDEIWEEKMPIIIGGLVIVLLMCLFGWALNTAMWKQGRKDCLEAQRYEQQYPQFQVNPKLNEYCVTKYNIQFKP